MQAAKLMNFGKDSVRPQARRTSWRREEKKMSEIHFMTHY